MKPQDQLNYERIATAIEYIQAHFQSQPNLDEVAEKVHLSPAHFQRLFTEWAGTSPKKFLQYISLQHAKSVLRGKQQATLFDATYQTGLSSTSRLHDLFVSIEAMTPAEYKNGGGNLSIHYSFVSTPFGATIVASTPKGICYMAFETDPVMAVENLRVRFPNADLTQKREAVHQSAVGIFARLGGGTPQQVKLHLKGTEFQLKVWESLLHIPQGGLTTYQSIARQIDNPKASRAVGSAIGSNPVAYLIPCHRVIQSSGVFGGYMWGPTRKAAIIGWEAAQNHVPVS